MNRYATALLVLTLALRMGGDGILVAEARELSGPTSHPIALIQGTRVGRPWFAAGDTDRGGQGQPAGSYRDQRVGNGNGC